jgi:hypothetical protein
VYSLFISTISFEVSLVIGSPLGWQVDRFESWQVETFQLFNL